MTPTAPEEGLRDLLIEEEMKGSYLKYAMSVIVSRALPDVRDGLKPSQRRILTAMNDLGLGPRSKFRKCAKIAGDTSGNYHPHGESVVYPTLVRLAQPWNMRYPLIQGQGNFGSIDGDGPAAMRYTEARLTSVAMELLEDINLDTVEYVPNYDGERQEPSVFPGKFPNLLCNGSAGIAVGMASSIPPHNLSEVVDALIATIENPQITLPELLEIIPGPDFPTGGTILGRAGIVEAYRTGRGLVTMRARGHVEDRKSGRKSLVFTEMPYQITKTRIIEDIVEGVKGGRLEGISDVRDESDKDGIRLVVDLKKGEDDQIVLNQLYAHTPLQSTFSIINIGLVNSRPETLGLRELLTLYRDHRVDVIRRRTRHLLAKAEHRAHIVEGLLLALGRIDDVIQTIKESPDVPTARDRLVERFGLTEIQADAILVMQLQRLTGLEREKLEEEYRGLQEKIANYRAILADERLVLQIIIEDLTELKERYGDARRTEITDDAGEIAIEDLIAEEEMVVTVSREGYIKRLPLSTYRLQGRGGKGKTGAETKEGDFVEHLFVASTHDHILFFTDQGRVHWRKVYEIPELSRQSRGRAIVNLLALPEGERLASLFPVRDFGEGGNLVFVTERGIVKKTELSAYGRPRLAGIIAIVIDEGDRLVGVRRTDGSQEVLVGTALGKAIRFAEEDARTMGRGTRGVRAIHLRKGDRVVDFTVGEEGANLLTVCELGYGKRTPFADYRLQKRGGQGVINIKLTKRNGQVVALREVREDEDVILLTQNGMIVRIAAETIRISGRSTQGVRLMTIDEGDRIVAIAKADREDEEPDLPEEPATTPPTANEPDEEEEPSDESGTAPEAGDEPDGEDALWDEPEEQASPWEEPGTAQEDPDEEEES
jgi:DNA gyrase subunit A